MKKQYSILWLMAMVVAATFTFTACSDDDDDKAPERLETTAYDDLDYFQRAIVDVDSLGNFQCRQYGVPLYDNDTTHLYIGVESIEAAEKIFRYWLAPDIEAVAAADNSITANLTDEDGKAQGTIFFRPGTAGTVAEVTASPETRLLHFSQVTFLLNSAWPFNNAASKWHVGDVVHNVHLDADVEKHLQNGGGVPRDWVCIRESGGTFSSLGITIGIPPMFCAVTKQSYNVPVQGKWIDAAAIVDSKYCPSVSTADAIKDLLHQDWDFFGVCFLDCGNGSPGGDGYWIDYYHSSWLKAFQEVYYYNSGFHYGENESSKVMKPFLLKIDWVADGEMHDGGTY